MHATSLDGKKTVLLNVIADPEIKNAVLGLPLTLLYDSSGKLNLEAQLSNYEGFEIVQLKPDYGSVLIHPSGYSGINSRYWETTYLPTGAMVKRAEQDRVYHLLFNQSYSKLSKITDIVRMAKTIFG